MNILASSSIYLCGAIESDPDCANWRRDLAIALSKIEPTLKVWDPIIKPDWVSEDVKNNIVAFDNKKHIESYLMGIPFDGLKAATCFEANKYVRMMCKMLANKCDILIARIPKTFTWGSIDELEIAINRKIPIFLWLPDGLISIYGLSGISKYELLNHYIHFNIDSLLSTIDSVNKGILDLPQMDPETWLYLTWRNVLEKNYE